MSILLCPYCTVSVTNTYRDISVGVGGGGGGTCTSGNPNRLGAQALILRLSVNSYCRSVKRCYFLHNYVMMFEEREGDKSFVSDDMHKYMYIVWITPLSLQVVNNHCFTS